MNARKIFLSILLTLFLLNFCCSFSKQTTYNNKNQSIEYNESKKWVDEKIKSLSLEEKIGQILIVNYNVNGNKLTLKKNDSIIKKYNIGGVLLPKLSRDSIFIYTKRINNISKLPLLIGITGYLNLYPSKNKSKKFPYSYTLGAANDIQLTELIGKMIGQESRRLGVQINLSPSLDIIQHCVKTGYNPKKIMNHIDVIVKGLKSQGILTEINDLFGLNKDNEESEFKIVVDLEIVESEIKKIINKVKSGEINEERINERCRKILEQKFLNFIRETKTLNKTYSEGEIKLAKRLIYEKSITVIKNEEQVLPINRFDKKIVHISIGIDSISLKRSINLISEIDHFQFNSLQEAKKVFSSKLSNYDLVITTLQSKQKNIENEKDLNDWIDIQDSLNDKILVIFDHPLLLKKINLNKINSIVIAYEDNPIALDRAGQFLMGTFSSSGKLPVDIISKYRAGDGIIINSTGRLKDSQPEELGINPIQLSEIDTIVKNSIKSKAFPGCQIVVAIKGKVIYRKSFGYHTYDKIREVTNTDIYDIASITKIAASTLALMHMESNNKFNLNNKLSYYLPELKDKDQYGNINLKSMMSHQSGLKSWIPFYIKTLNNNELRSDIYQDKKSDLFSTQVSSNLWIVNGYTNKIYEQILETPLKGNRYKYSDVGYYFLKKIIENKSGLSLDKYMKKYFYNPIGLSNITYNPTKYFPLNQIIPTEYDTIFRKEQIHGYVHDQGAAMIGGIGGHAGLFSNAGDLASLMQLLLNNGEYADISYINPNVVKRYTECQYCPLNRRGAGFDKPKLDLNGGPTCELVSLSSFGHSGFTGTLVWSDPVNEINYVFLSNRVYPNADNWKIVKMNVRTDIQRVIYKALKGSKI
ncbi:MAG: hypothetical protein CL844_01790 [Crocinitomicaceae bacterium]|nr:hypothetical protein [Crocinitomicaceae bacterium]|tara:strand:- start:32155 stop:34758 length:2604 start_codon:yes stop_codon:yes gene_type:complete